VFILRVPAHADGSSNTIAEDPAIREGSISGGPSLPPRQSTIGHHLRHRCLGGASDSFAVTSRSTNGVRTSWTLALATLETRSQRLLRSRRAKQGRWL
jgi:hypothetical protein